MPKLSIVVPVYKVEDYLKECVDSILNQSFKDFELILVDDGSPDSCPKLCDDYSKLDSRVKVIHKSNGGLSSARNAGMRVAKGDYISFIDSDDYLDLDTYNKVFSIIAKEQADVVIFGRCYVYEDNRKVVREKQGIYKVMTGAEATALMNTSLLGYYDVAAWDKVYKRSLFDGIEYPEGKLSEDWYTTYKVFARAQKVAYDSKPLYYYRQRGGSITHNARVNYDAIYASKEVLDFVKKEQPEFLREAIFSYVYATIGVMDNLIEQQNIDKVEIKKIRNSIEKYYKTVLRYPGLRGKRKVQLFLAIKATNIYILIFKRAKESL